MFRRRPSGTQGYDDLAKLAVVRLGPPVPGYRAVGELTDVTANACDHPP